MGEWDKLMSIRVIKQSPRQKITLMCDEYGEKYLKREIEGDKREIYKTLKTLDCACIPKIYHVDFNDTTTVIEEFVEGTSLAQMMDAGEKISKKSIKKIFSQLVKAMEAIHSVKIIHRDIKPDNIILDKKGQAYLIDFDIARIYRPEIRKDTEKMGTFGYAPIEQYGMLPTDFKTDIYSFGVTVTALMEYAGMKGVYYTVAQKCKKLDPMERYKTPGEIKKAVLLKKLKPFAVLMIFLLLLGAGICLLNKESVEEEATLPTVEEETKEEYILPQGVHFADFETDNTQKSYSHQPNFGDAMVFAMYTQWDHLLFLEDGNKKGKITLGRKNTLIDGDITLKNGVITVKLDDGKGNSFEHEFFYNNEYSYVDNYPSNRKNGDIICCDWNDDGAYELLIGLSDGAMGVMEGRFYNYLNYCMAWCVTYSEEEGFTLCNEDMFSKGGSFYMAEYSNTLGVCTRFDRGDVTGYCLEDDTIIKIY